MYQVCSEKNPATVNRMRTVCTTLMYLAAKESGLDARSRTMVTSLY